MSVIASAQITLAIAREYESCTRYYLLQSSTLSKPAKPTANPPGGSWVKAEPTYTAGSTMSLYLCDLNVYSDGQYDYSEVSLSSAYEAAKAAWNKAQNAQDAVDSLEIGGRNLIKNTLNVSVTSAENYPRLVGQTANTFAHSSCVVTAAGHGIRVTVGTGASAPFVRLGTNSVNVQSLHGLEKGQPYTLSFDYTVKLFSGSATATYYFRACLYDDSAVTGTYNISAYANFERFATGTYGEERTGRGTLTFTIPEAATTMYLFVGPSNNTNTLHAVGDFIELRNLKLEKGNQATDWTPAPEDVADDIDDAKAAAGDAQAAADEAQAAADAVTETVNSLVRVKSDGLHVVGYTEDEDGVRTETGGEVLISSDGMNVIVGGKVYSRFASDYVEFGNYQLRRVGGGLAFKLRRNS